MSGIVGVAGTSKVPGNRYSIGESIASSVTHGIGALLAVAALVLLVVFATMRGTAVQIVSYAIFGSSLVVLYTASTVYHAVQEPRARLVLEVIDHSSVYLLIAGTYTAFALGIVGGWIGWVVFGVEWGLAALGILYKTMFFSKLPRLSLVFYLVMGWVIVLAWEPLARVAPPGTLFFLIAGGIAYTVGTVFYALKRVKWFHAVWHLFVLAGSICHFFAAILAL